MKEYKVSKLSTMWYLRSLGYDVEPSRTGITVYIAIEKALKKEAIEKVKKLVKDFGYAGKVYVCPEEIR
jgi:hypothetical protein